MNLDKFKEYHKFCEMFGINPSYANSLILFAKIKNFSKKGAKLCKTF